MGNLYIISDPHIKHKNIVRGISSWTSGYRDFNTQDEHDWAIINNVNEVVTEDDTLICLGDWVMGQDKKENLKWFLSKLKVRDIVTCVGNHDRKDVLIEVFGLSKVHDILEFKHNGHTIIAGHYPIEFWKDMSWTLHIFGHLHSKPARVRGPSMDVGLDGNNLKPYLLDDVVEFLSKQAKLPDRHDIGEEYVP